MQKNSSISNSKKIPAAFLIALPICLVLRFGDLFFPPQTFTHRLWEALIVHTQHEMLPGPFYPNQKSAMTEQGDLAPYTPYAVKKRVTWETDRYGFRIRDQHAAPEIVVVGDSTILGTGLDQKEMLSSVLSEALRTTVYPYAPYYSMEPYFSDSRFRDTPPKIVIFSMMEWALPDLLEKTSPLNVKKCPLDFLIRKHVPKPFYEKLAIILDRMSKMSLMRFMEARFRGLIKNLAREKNFETASYKNSVMVFPKGKAGHSDISLEKIDPILKIIKSYQTRLEAQGIHFLFLPIPNKETVYEGLLPSRPKPVFFAALLHRARSLGISVIDIQEAYISAVTQGELIYHPDDSHWNGRGVQVAAKIVEKELEKSHDSASV